MWMKHLVLIQSGIIAGRNSSNRPVLLKTNYPRCFVKTACGRSRYNVLGALNFCGKKVPTVTNDPYISAEQVVLLMTRLLAEYKDKALALVLDNAAYQRCKKAGEYAKEHGIDLIFLPPY
jgi:hypothetical protein